MIPKDDALDESEILRDRISAPEDWSILLNALQRFTDQQKWKVIECEHKEEEFKITIFAHTKNWVQPVYTTPNGSVEGESGQTEKIATEVSSWMREHPKDIEN